MIVYIPDMYRNWPGYDREETRIWPRNALELSRNCNGTDPKLLARSAPELHRNCNGTDPEVHRNCNGTAPELHRNCTGTDPEVHRNCNGTAPGLHRNCTGTAPGLLREYNAIFWRYSVRCSISRQWSALIVRSIYLFYSFTLEHGKIDVILCVEWIIRFP